MVSVMPINSLFFGCSSFSSSKGSIVSTIVAYISSKEEKLENLNHHFLSIIHLRRYVSRVRTTGQLRLEAECAVFVATWTDLEHVAFPVRKSFLVSLHLGHLSTLARIFLSLFENDQPTQYQEKKNERAHDMDGSRLYKLSISTVVWLFSVVQCCLPTHKHVPFAQMQWFGNRWPATAHWH